MLPLACLIGFTIYPLVPVHDHFSLLASYAAVKKMQVLDLPHSHIWQPSSSVLKPCSQYISHRTSGHSVSTSHHKSICPRNMCCIGPRYSVTWGEHEETDVVIQSRLACSALARKMWHVKDYLMWGLVMHAIFHDL